MTAGHAVDTGPTAHSMKRSVCALWAASALIGACSNSTTHAKLNLCGGRVVLNSNVRLIGSTSEDGIHLYYIAPAGDQAPPEDLASIFTASDGRTRLVDLRREVGPEVTYLGKIEAVESGCSGLVSLQIGSAASEVLLDVPGAVAASWVVAVNVGQDA